MKHLTIVFLTVVFSGIIHGQILGVEDLIDRLECETFSCYNDFVSEKGFSLINSGDLDGGVPYYRFQSDKRWVASSNTIITTRNQSIIINLDGVWTTIGFGTSYKPHYELFLNEAKRLGFKEMSTYSEGEFVTTKFESSNYPGIGLVRRIQTLTKGDESWTYYDLQVSN